jgi:hypothetical protein
LREIWSAALPLVLIVLFFILPLYLLLWLRKLQRRNRRSPLTAKLLRGPGETLCQQLAEVQWDFSGYLAGLLTFPFLMLSVHLSQSVFGGVPESSFRWLLIAATITGGTIFFYKLLRFSKLRLDLQNGLEAEIAVGQELDQLMREGAVVFHDVPAEGFNIDHVALAPTGVFAIETKARMKPDRGGGKNDAPVEFNGEVLSFPDWRDREILEQTRWQAKWLSKWLSSAVGESISVKPVVALPGWYVKRTGRGDVTVISGREAFSLLKGAHAVFSDQQITRIGHQLEQRCRDVEPTLYGRQRKFGRDARQTA